jgi:enoyl-CoA hydratase
MHLTQSELEPGILSVRLTRPPVNAVNQEMYREIAETFRAIAYDPTVRAVILSSDNERVFCAGNDLHEFVTMTPDNGDLRMKEVREAFWALYDCSVPVIGAINGTAVGTGFALAACCDILVAAEGVRFGLPEISVGVLGGGKFGARLLPELVMRRIFLTGETLSAEEVAEFGSIASIVPRAGLMDAALEIARKIAAKSPSAVRLGKQSLNAVEPMGLKPGYELEQTFTVRLSGLPEAKEAVQAVIEKRPPNFS